MTIPPLDGIPQPTHLLTVVRDTIERLESLAGSREVVLRHEVPPGLPPVFIGERPLRRILVNLIGNAAASTRRGQVVVRVRSGGNPPRAVSIEVADTGPGLSGVFVRALLAGDTAWARAGDPDSSGLGLRVCWSLARRIGCKMEVESRLGEGSTFRILLPRSEGAMIGESQRGGGPVGSA